MHPLMAVASNLGTVGNNNLYQKHLAVSPKHFLSYVDGGGMTEFEATSVASL